MRAVAGSEQPSFGRANPVQWLVAFDDEHLHGLTTHPSEGQAVRFATTDPSRQDGADPWSNLERRRQGRLLGSRSAVSVSQAIASALVERARQVPRAPLPRACTPASEYCHRRYVVA